MSISNEIITILDDLGKRIGIAIDWSSQNITPYITELFGRFIKWEIATSIIWIVFATIVIALYVVWVVKGYKKFENANVFDEDGYILITVMGLFVGIVFVVVMGTQIFDICRCIYLPELEIYNYISGLMK